MIRPLLVRSGTRDIDIFDEVISNNGYKLDDTVKGTVIDIGAHIGCFSIACCMRGADRVVAFEADDDNHKMACKNAASLPIEVHHKAVWRSDVECEVLNHTGYRDNNTGIGNVIGWLQPVDASIMVKTVSLDAILTEVGEVEVLKIDCEGSEYAILATSQRLGQIKTIVGEYHSLTSMVVPDYAKIPGWTTYSGGTLLQFLEAQGFKVDRWGHKGKTGMFKAWR